MNDSPAMKTMVRLPPDVKAWLEATSERNCSTQTAEIVRSLRDRMAREARATA